MAETTEIIVSAIIFFLILIGIYHRFLRKLVLPVSAKTVLEGLKGKLGGKIERPNWSLKTIATWVIVALFGFLMIYNGILEVPDKVFSAEELLNYTVSGNCQVQGDELVCAGQWKIFIPDPDKKTIGKLTIVPGTDPIRAINIEVGPYRADYSQGDLKQFGGTICGYAMSGVYHRAMLYYNGKPKIYTCIPVPVPNGQAPEDLYFGTTWLRLLIPDSEDPQFYVGWDIIARSRINDIPQRYLGGDITLSSQQSVRIKSLNVVYSSYKII